MRLLSPGLAFCSHLKRRLRPPKKEPRVDKVRPLLNVGSISAALWSPVLVSPRTAAGNRAYNNPGKNRCVFKFFGISVEGASNYQERNVQLGSDFVRRFEFWLFNWLSFELFFKLYNGGKNKNNKMHKQPPWFIFLSELKLFKTVFTWCRIRETFPTRHYC